MMEWKYPLLLNLYRGSLDPTEVARARRVAVSMGWRVEKSRERYQHHNNQCALQIPDHTNKVINGVNYDMTPEDVIGFCEAFDAHIELITQGDR
jgi:hypothetical protein